MDKLYAIPAAVSTAMPIIPLMDLSRFTSAENPHFHAACCYELSMADELQEALDSAILANINSPKRVRGDMGEVENQSVGDLIALDRYRRRRMRGNPLGNIRLTKIIPSGAE